MGINQNSGPAEAISAEAGEKNELRDEQFDTNRVFRASFSDLCQMSLGVTVEPIFENQL
ncbi:MAG: hypothetical protein AAFQ02_01265 [Bacteroidota bacterium]